MADVIKTLLAKVPQLWKADVRPQTRSKPRHQKRDDQKPQHPEDLEKGSGASVVGSDNQSDGSAKTSRSCKDKYDSAMRDVRAVKIYQQMVGILDAEPLGYLDEHRPADNVGIYERVAVAEHRAQRSYTFLNYLINSCYFLQIIVAASLTAMGAASVDHSAITAFGAINTIIAGFLTFLKGSGLPGRYKYFAGEWKRVREFIEQVERELSRVEPSSEAAFTAVRAVEAMYEAAKREVELNTPDKYNSISGGEDKEKDAEIHRLKEELRASFTTIHNQRKQAKSEGKVVEKELGKNWREGEAAVEHGMHWGNIGTSSSTVGDAALDAARRLSTAVKKPKGYDGGEAGH